MARLKKPRPLTRTTYMPPSRDSWERLALFDKAMSGVDGIAEEQEA